MRTSEIWKIGLTAMNRSPAAVAVREYARMTVTEPPFLAGFELQLFRTALHLAETFLLGLDCVETQLAHFSLHSTMAHVWHRLVLSFQARHQFLDEFLLVVQSPKVTAF